MAPSLRSHRHLDDVVNEIRQCLLSQRDPLIIKIANAETADQELCTFTLCVDDAGVLSKCGQDTDRRLVGDNETALLRQGRPAPYARPGAAATAAQERTEKPSQTANRPSSFSYEAEQELRRRQLRIEQLELKLSHAQNELRRARLGDTAASSASPSDQSADVRNSSRSSSTSSGSDECAINGSSADSPMSASTSNSDDSALEAATNMSRLQLQHGRPASNNEDDADDESAAEQSRREEGDEMEAVASSTSQQDGAVEEGSSSRRSGRQRKVVGRFQYAVSTSTASVNAAKRRLASSASVPSGAKKSRREVGMRVEPEVTAMWRTARRCRTVRRWRSLL